MKITEVETYPIDLEGHGRMGYLIVVRTDQGINGLGEAAADCHPATVDHAIRQMPLAGRDPGNIEKFWQDMYHGTFWRGGPIWTSAVSGVGQALWDIKGNALGAPVYDLVGGAVRDPGGGRRRL